VYNLKSALLFAMLAAAVSACHPASKGGRPPDLPYQHRLTDLNGQTVELGERLQDGRREGHWRFYDQQGRITRTETYQTGVLQGPAIEYFHDNPDDPTRFQGHNAQGHKVGRWELWQGYRAVKEQGEGRWKKVALLDYDDTGRLRTRSQLHPNGRVAVAFSMSIEGRDSHYRQYSPRGKLIGEGTDLPVINL
jgi:antitoxin component YwqK of YwqJK toxin-antitoxin module